MDQAKDKFKAIDVNQYSQKYAKLLVDGTTGRILEKDGENNWIA